MLFCRHLFEQCRKFGAAIRFVPIDDLISALPREATTHLLKGRANLLFAVRHAGL